MTPDDVINDPELQHALKARLDVGDDYARRLEEAVLTWQSLDSSPHSLLDLNDTHLLGETPLGQAPWPTRPTPIATDITALLPDPIVLLDAEGKVRQWNPAAAAAFGWSAAEVLGQLPPFVALAQRAEHDAILAAARHDNPIRERVVLRTCRDGKTRALHLFATAAPNGDVLLQFRPLAAPIAHDSSTTTPAHEARLETLGRMVASVSHDFRNVLTAISGSGDLLADRIPANSPDREWVDVIRTAARHATGLTQRLLDFAKATPATGPTDIAAVVHDLEPLIRALVPNGVRIRVNTEMNLPAAAVEPTVVEQVLLNLAINAGQAMPRGGVLQVHVAERSRDDGTFVVLSVADTGGGIDDSIQARLFEPFVSTRCSTGIGLATVRELVQQARGQIDVESHTGLGSLFRVFLPVADPAPPVDGRGLNALVVDDDPSIRDLATECLESVGFDVTVAASGDEALRMARWRDYAIDLLVADVVMPGLGGRRLVERLRESRPELPVVFISGYRPVDDPTPDTAFVAKPFVARHLLAAVGAVLTARAEAIAVR